MISDMERNKAFNAIIIAQCFGQVAGLCFANGLMFNYLTYLKFSEESMVIFLRLPSIIALFTTLPLAYMSDMKGKSRYGQIGNLIQAIGIACLCVAAYISDLKTLAVVGGVILFSFGVSLLNSSWFALLDPIIPPHQRGPFFAKLRIIWQLFGLVFNIAAQFLLDIWGDSVLAPIFMCVVLFCFIRMYYYGKIPELESRDKSLTEKEFSFKDEFRKLLQSKDYVKYCIFISFLVLGMGSLTLIFNLYEKEYLNFNSADIVLMGNLALIGGIAGFGAGAAVLRRHGERVLFFLNICCISICCLLFPMHDFFDWIPVKIYVGSLTFCTGLSISALSIGITSLMLHLLPKENKSLSTSFFLVGNEIGSAFGAGLLSALIYLFSGNTESEFMHVNVYTVSLLAVGILLPAGVLLFNKIIVDSR